MKRKLLAFETVLGLLFLVYFPVSAGSDCAEPEPVCAGRSAVFAISAFDPLGSATRIGERILVTSRHVVADRADVKLRLADGRTVSGRVVPSGYSGDLVLIETGELPEGPFFTPSDVSPRDSVFSIGADLDMGRIRAYPSGTVHFMPDKKHPFARIHHTAHSQPGNSGGALVNASGRLVGIIASGGEGRFEAIPAGEITRLKEASGTAFKDISARVGTAIRGCVLKIEELRRLRVRAISDQDAKAVSMSCTQSRNRQLVDLAGQVLGRFGRFDASIRLFKSAIAEDPNAVNSRIGLIVSQSIAGRYEESLPHIRWLIDHNVHDAQVLRFALQSGVWGDDKNLAKQALRLLKKVSPETASGAERFFNAPPPRPKRRP